MEPAVKLCFVFLVFLPTNLWAYFRVDSQSFDFGPKGVCTTSDRELSCFGSPAPHSSIDVLSPTNKVVVGAGVACRNHKKGVQCWGSRNLPKQLSTDPVDKMVAGNEFVCLLRQGQVECFCLLYTSDAADD